MTRRRPPWADREVLQLAELADEFVEREALPLRAGWETRGRVDRTFWRRAGELGLLCTSIPVDDGGGGGSLAHDLVVFRASLSRAESGFGIGNAVHSGVVAHYIHRHGSAEQRQRWLPKMASGEAIGAIAMTEPDGGSDLQAIRTSATRAGDHFVVNGSKTFITNGAQADVIVLVVKTDPSAGARGVSLLLVDTATTPGFRAGEPLDKIGLPAQDTAELFFHDMRVPAAELLGQVGDGFGYLMAGLVRERLILADTALAVAEAAILETVRYVRERKLFGESLFQKQNTRFELARCATMVRSCRAFVDECVVAFLADELDPATVSMAKLQATEVQGEVVDRCLQLFGGYGFMREFPIARMFVDARAQRIYGGANEVMCELIARSL